MKPTKIIDVYQTVWGDTEGNRQRGSSFYSTYHTAQLASDALGRDPEPIARKAVELDDGQIWLLEERGPCTLYHKVEEAKKEAALNKLTKEERKLLGLE